MVKAMLAIVAKIRTAPVLETIGAGLLTAGAAVQWGTAAGLATAGGCLVLKAFDA